MDFSFYRKLRTPAPLRNAIKKFLRNKKAVALVLGCLVLGGYVVFSNHGVLMRFRLQRQKIELEQKIKVAEEEGKSIQRQSKALDTDRTAVEKIAREKYGMARQGETVYKVKKDEE
jgi:cell division protein FtsB